MADSGQQTEATRPAPASLEDCVSRLDEARREADELRDKYLRAVAQAENTRKWVERDIQARAMENKRDLTSDITLYAAFRI